jgi:hypothetical protein
MQNEELINVVEMVAKYGKSRSEVTGTIEKYATVVFAIISYSIVS